MRATGPKALAGPALAMALLMPAGAAPRAQESDRAETVRVEGEGSKAGADQTGSVTVIHADDYAARVATVTDLLAQAVGLHVRSYGGLGSFATVSIRGSTAEQVNIYVDGVLLNPALGGAVNLADFSLSSIDSIEIYRGFTPSSLGGGAIGGAINIRTKRPGPGRAAGSGSLSFGSYGTAEAAGVASWSDEPAAARRADGLLSIDVSRSDGDFRFYDNNGTLQTAGDDGFTTRRNNQFASGELLGRSGLSLPGGGRLGFSASLTARRQGVPGIEAFQSPDARSEMTRALLRSEVSDLSLGGSAARLDAGVYYTRTWQRFQDRTGGTTGGLSVDARGIFDAAGLSTSLRFRAGGQAAPGFATITLSTRRETAARDDFTLPHPDRGGATRYAWSLVAEDEIHLAGGRVILSPTGRWEGVASRFDDPPSGQPSPAARDDARMTGRLGAAWRPRPSVALRAAAGRFHREPSFTELFGDQGSVSGSDDLTPEAGWNYEVGSAWEPTRPSTSPLSRLRLETTLFRNDADNLIQFVQTSQKTVVARNTGRARVAGAEMSAALTLFGCLAGDLNYTWQVATDRSDTFRRGSDLPGRPRHEVSAGASLSRGWGRPFYEFSYVGPSFFDPAASAVAGSGVSRDLIRAPGRYLHDVGYTRGLGARLEATIEVDNVFNVKTVDVVRYPLPGRLVQAKLRLKLP